jgi:uncharacterized RDD family membrane protein YckC
VTDFETTSPTDQPSDMQPSEIPKEILPANAPYASPVTRFLAFVIDTGILTVSGTMIWKYYTSSSGLTPEELKAQTIVPELLQALMNFFYKPIFESSVWQATPGKKLFRLKVTDLCGQRIGLGRAVLRHLAWMLSALPLLFGYIMAFLTIRKQCLHDKIVKTVVIKAN